MKLNRLLATFISAIALTVSVSVMKILWIFLCAFHLLSHWLIRIYFSQSVCMLISQLLILVQRCAYFSRLKWQQNTRNYVAQHEKRCACLFFFLELYRLLIYFVVLASFQYYGVCVSVVYNGIGIAWLLYVASLRTIFDENSFKFWVSALRLSLLFFTVILLFAWICIWFIFCFYFVQAAGVSLCVFSLCWQRWCNINSKSKTANAQEKQNSIEKKNIHAYTRTHATQQKKRTTERKTMRDR